MKLLIALSLILLVGAASLIYVGVGSQSTQASSVARLLATETEQAATDPQSLTFGLRRVVERQVAQTKSEGSLESSLSDTSSNISIDRIRVALDQPGLPPVSKNALIQTARRSFVNDDKIKTELSEVARRELLSTRVSLLPSPEGSEEGASSELIERRIEEKLLITTCHEVYLATSSSSEDAMSNTIQALGTHADPEVRNEIIGQFVARFPDAQNVFRERLAAMGL